MINEIREKIKSIIYDIKDNLDGKIVDENTDLFQELEMDSLEIMKFIVELEDKFQVQFEDIDELMEVMRSVGSVAEFIYKHINTAENE